MFIPMPDHGTAAAAFADRIPTWPLEPESKVGTDANTYQYDFAAPSDDVDACFRTLSRGAARQTTTKGSPEKSTESSPRSDYRDYIGCLISQTFMSAVARELMIGHSRSLQTPPSCRGSCASDSQS